MEEVASFAAVTSSGAGGGGGEFRRLHIVYFLTRMGRIEHPHLIRVRHLNRNGGVYLRDVKRWMGELRGKDMPDSFSWSYKRRYKTGYIWQDLIDDDLITPISDNEYVLKGSDIMADYDISTYNSTILHNVEANSYSSSSSSSSTFDPQNDAVSKDENQPNRECLIAVENQEQGKQHYDLDPVATKHSNQSYSSTSSSPPPSPPATKLPSWSSHQQFPILSPSSSSDGNKPTETPSDDPDHPKTPIIVDEKTTEIGSRSRSSSNLSSSSYYTYTSDHIIKPRKKPNSSSDSRSQSPTTKSRSSWRQRYYSNTASSRGMLRKLMVCGGPADTAVVNAANNKSTSLRSQSTSTVNTQNRGNLAGSAELQLKLHHDRRNQSSRRRKNGFEGSKGSSSKKQDSLFCRQTDVSAAYRPVGAPTCTQCGKSFRPEKLHMHMSKHCRGMRGVGKDATAYPEEELSNPGSPCKPFVKKQLINAVD
ncbi:Protein SOSEKI 1 [Linum perenne]